MEDVFSILSAFVSQFTQSLNLTTVKPKCIWIVGSNLREATEMLEKLGTIHGESSETVIKVAFKGNLILLLRESKESKYVIIKLRHFRHTLGVTPTHR